MRHLLVVLFAIGVCHPLSVAAANSCDSGESRDRRAQVLAGMALNEVQNCADNGDIVALNEMGRRYGNGKDVPLDSEKSLHFYEKAAAAGYSQAKANLAYMYFNGEGTTKNFEIAFRLNTEAAEAGVAQAQYALGYSFTTGVGAGVNAVLAEKYFLAAADQGFLPAQQALVTFYSNGKLVPRNEEQAIMWLHRFTQAANYGHVWRKGNAD